MKANCNTCHKTYEVDPKEYCPFCDSTEVHIMKKYEYKSIVCPNKGLVFSPDSKLNKYGADGWEAYAATNQSDGNLVVLMKREVMNQFKA